MYRNVQECLLYNIIRRSCICCRKTEQNTRPRYSCYSRYQSQNNENMICEISGDIDIKCKDWKRDINQVTEENEDDDNSSVSEEYYDTVSEKSNVEAADPKEKTVGDELLH